MVDAFGNVPGDFMNVGFLLLNPMRLMFQKYIDLVENTDNKDFVANFVRMEKWIFDSPDQAGEAFRQFVKYMYQDNLLVKGKLKIGGRPVSLKNITQPVLNVFAEKDHLVPPASSRPFTALVGSADKKILSFPTGHIGLFTSSKSQREYAPAIASWLAEHSQQTNVSASTTEDRTSLKKTELKMSTAKKGKRKKEGP
jgi:polyhydroxyalkanoate synthase